MTTSILPAKEENHRAFFQEKESGTLANPQKRKLIYIPDADISIDYTDNDVKVLKGNGDFVSAPLITNFPDKIVEQAKIVLNLHVETRAGMDILDGDYILQYTQCIFEQMKFKTMLLHFLAENMIELLKEKDRLRRI